MNDQVGETTPVDRSSFFIAGCPRSGTTLTGQILDGHSRLAVYLEMNYYSTFRHSCRLYGDLRLTNNRRRFVRDVQEHLRAQRADPPSVDEIEHALAAPTFEGILDALLAIHAAKQGKARGGDKTPLNYAFLPEILSGFPHSSVVYLVRDPRDVVLSMRKAWNATTHEATRMWNAAYLTLVDVPSSRVQVLRYEELAEDPSGSTRRLCKALGERFEPEMLDLAGRVPDQLRSVRHLDLSKLDGPVVPSSIGTHKEMSRSEIREIEAACGLGMEALGYTFSGRAPRITAPAIDGPGFLRRMVERLRYYGTNRERWRRGAVRWRMALRIRARWLIRRSVRRVDRRTSGS